MVRISEKDRRIIEMLLENARKRYTEIAREMGITEAAVRKRIRKLESEGIIRGYSANVNPRSIGFTVTAFIGFDVEPEHYTNVVKEVSAFPEIKRLYSTTGDHMFMAECWFRSSEEMNTFIEKLSAIKGVTKVCPAIVVERIK